MKTETLINTFLGFSILGFICTVILLVAMRSNNPEPCIVVDESKPPYDQSCYQCNPDTACNWCDVIKAYSLNVNVYHYGDSVGE